MHKNLQPPRGHLHATIALFRLLTALPAWLRTSHQPLAYVDIARDYIGVNVAPSSSSDVNDYTLGQLNKLGLSQARMDLSYGGIDGEAEGLLQLLISSGYEVLINVFPSPEAAARLPDDAGEQQRWREFITTVFSRYQGKVRQFEIGNTPNRGKWSGFSGRGFLHAWAIAIEVADAFDVTLAGPNVSDFEPLYSGVFLDLMHSLGRAPQTHTNNLFVERVVEPEAFDHRILGSAFTRLININLIKKARILAAIGERFGSEDFVCTYTCWTYKRLSRRNLNARTTAANYLVRYLSLAASSGALKQVFWGPLICHRDGLVDDAAKDYPAVDQVSFYKKVRGEELADFKETPAFSALKFWWQISQGSRLHTLHHNADAMTVLRFQTRDQRHFLLLWCRDAIAVPLAALLESVGQPPIGSYDTLGQAITLPAVATEHPLYLEFDTAPQLQASALHYAPHLQQLAHLSGPYWQGVPVENKQWRGALALHSDKQSAELAQAEAVFPEHIRQLEELAVLRDARNRLWNVRDPRGVVDTITVKLNRVKGIKKLTYRFRPSKGRRHWNNANHMLRRGIATPAPLGFFEAHENSGVCDSLYYCEFVPQAFSSRDVYAAFNAGEQSFRGLDKSAWFKLLAEFVCQTHNKQVVHRDLSAGNLLIREIDGEFKPMLIDIGRAWVWIGQGSPVKPRHRLLDLIRICYKLSWPDRELFIHHYAAAMGGSLGKAWRIPFHYYDNKQRLKKRIKGKHRKRSRRL